MRLAIEIVGVLNLVLFAVIAAVCVRQWLRDRATTSMWAALAFVSLAVVAASGYVLPDEPGSTAEKVELRIVIVLLLPKGGASRGVGILGLLCALVPLVALAGGHLRMDLHGFGAFLLMQAIWSCAVAVLLLRGRP